MSTQKEAAQTLRDVYAQLQKISGESSQTLARVKELQDIIDNQTQPISDELQEAVDRVKNQAQVVDDLTPDITDGSGIASGNDQPRVLGVDGNGIQTGVGPNGETGRKGPTAQL